MLSNSTEIVALFISLLLGVVSINCYAQTPVVSCPSSFSDAHGVHKLDDVYAYDGPVCMKVSLVPEYKKNKQVWDLDALRDPSLVCTYENTEHYVVINAKGAAYCERTTAPVQVKCMP
ncbi:STY0301 family protein [Snodgrassella sp. ESL0324]|uniref:STY0301 family protein n=1 Tax=Snodgrassella sp. ESL0324 TaxID=2705033 RepID=UPI00351BB165